MIIQQEETIESTPPTVYLIPNLWLIQQQLRKVLLVGPVGRKDPLNDCCLASLWAPTNRTFCQLSFIPESSESPHPRIRTSHQAAQHTPS